MRALVPEGEWLVAYEDDPAMADQTQVELPVANRSQRRVVPTDLVVHAAPDQQRNRDDAIGLQEVVHCDDLARRDERGPAELDLAVAVDPLEDDVGARCRRNRFRVRVERVDHEAEELRGPGVVIVMDDDEFSARALCAEIRGRFHRSCAAVDVDHLGAAFHQRFTGRDERIDWLAVSAVIDDDEMPIGHRLREHVIESPEKQLYPVLRADDDAHSLAILGHSTQPQGRELSQRSINGEHDHQLYRLACGEPERGRSGPSRQHR